MDFSWLNELPDSRWLVDDSGAFYLPISVQEFSAASGIAENQAFRKQFDEWGGQQERNYVAVAVPGPSAVPFLWVFATLEDRGHPRRW